MTDVTIRSWTASPPRFAEYVHAVRCVRAGQLLWVSIDLSVKRLAMDGQPQVDDRDLVVECVPNDPHSVPVWPSFAPWLNPPAVVSLRIPVPGLLADETAVMIVGATRRYRIEVLLLVVDPDMPQAHSQFELQRASDMPADRHPDTEVDT